jgi:hypothetical protein
MCSEVVEHPPVGRHDARARFGLRRRERSRRRAGRLLPLTVDRDGAAEEVDSVDGQPRSFGLTQDEAGADHDGSLERLGGRGEERVDLIDRHREDRRRVDSRQPDATAWIASAEEAVVERSVEHAGDVLHHDSHRIRREWLAAHERLDVALADRRDRPVAEMGDRVAQPFLDRAVCARPPVASLAIAQRDFGKRRAAESGAARRCPSAAGAAYRRGAARRRPCARTTSTAPCPARARATSRGKQRSCRP